MDHFYKVLGKAEVKHANFYALRHTFATRALECGIAAKTVSELLRHANISTTLDLYSHVSDELKKESIDKLTTLFL
jgi:integrase